MTIKELREKHKKEIEQYQNNCKHQKTKWLPYMYAPGHFAGTVNVCEECDKILEHAKDEVVNDWDVFENPDL